MKFFWSKQKHQRGNLDSAKESSSLFSLFSTKKKKPNNTNNTKPTTITRPRIIPTATIYGLTTDAKYRIQKSLSNWIRRTESAIDNIERLQLKVSDPSIYKELEGYKAELTIFRTGLLQQHSQWKASAAWSRAGATNSTSKLLPLWPLNFGHLPFLSPDIEARQEWIGTRYGTIREAHASILPRKPLTTKIYQMVPPLTDSQRKRISKAFDIAQDDINKAMARLLELRRMKNSKNLQPLSEKLMQYYNLIEEQKEAWKFSSAWKGTEASKLPMWPLGVPVENTKVPFRAVQNLKFTIKGTPVLPNKNFQHWLNRTVHQRLHNERKMVKPRNVKTIGDLYTPPAMPSSLKKANSFNKNQQKRLQTLRKEYNAATTKAQKNRLYNQLANAIFSTA